MRVNGLPAFFREIHIQQWLVSAKLFQISKVEVFVLLYKTVEVSPTCAQSLSSLNSGFLYPALAQLALITP